MRSVRRHRLPRCALLLLLLLAHSARRAPAQISAIKEALQEKEGIDVKQIRLIHSGKQLCVTRCRGAGAVAACGGGRAGCGLRVWHGHSRSASSLAPPPPLQ